MKKALKKETTIYHIKDGVRIEGAPEGVTGNLTSIRGNLSGIRGNIDDCKITDEERANGVDIKDLIAD